MRIEMFGPPTSGKSALVRELRRRGLATGKLSLEADRSVLPQAWQAFADKLDWLYDAEGSSPLAGKFQVLPNKTLGALSAAAEAAALPWPVVYDELVMQCGLSIAIRVGTDEAAWRWYFETAPLPDLLVSMTAPVEVLTARNADRGDRDRTSKTLRTLKPARRALEILNGRDCPIREFDTSTIPTAAIADQVVREAAALCRK